MAETRIADVIVPEIFAPYVINETTEKSACLKVAWLSRIPVLKLVTAAKVARPSICHSGTTSMVTPKSCRTKKH